MYVNIVHILDELSAVAWEIGIGLIVSLYDQGFVDVTSCGRVPCGQR